MKDWKTSPKWSRFFRISDSRAVAGSAASKRVSPRTEMVPASGVSRKLRQRRSVVLPLPEEPMMAMARPSSREKLMFFSTSVEPKDLPILRTSKIAIVPPPI